MYTAFYNLEADPFLSSTAPASAYQHESFANARSYIESDLMQSNRFTLISGAAGVGKSTLVAEVLNQYPMGNLSVLHLGSSEGRRDIFAELGELLQLRPAPDLKALESISAELLKRTEDGKKTIIVVEELDHDDRLPLRQLAQLIEALEDDQASYQLILLVDLELRSEIMRGGENGLSGYIHSDYELLPLSRDGTNEYIRHRLKAANWQDDPVIEAPVVDLIFLQSGGLPETINALCGDLLNWAAAREKHVIGLADSLSATGSDPESNPLFSESVRQQSQARSHQPERSQARRNTIVDLYDNGYYKNKLTGTPEQSEANPLPERKRHVATTLPPGPARGKTASAANGGIEAANSRPSVSVENSPFHMPSDPLTSASMDNNREARKISATTSPDSTERTPLKRNPVSRWLLPISGLLLLCLAIGLTLALQTRDVFETVSAYITTLSENASGVEEPVSAGPDEQEPMDDVVLPPRGIAENRDADHPPKGETELSTKVLSNEPIHEHPLNSSTIGSTSDTLPPNTQDAPSATSTDPLTEGQVALVENKRQSSSGVDGADPSPEAIISSGDEPQTMAELSGYASPGHRQPAEDTYSDSQEIPTQYENGRPRSDEVAGTVADTHSDDRNPALTAPDNPGAASATPENTVAVDTDSQGQKDDAPVNYLDDGVTRLEGRSVISIELEDALRPVSGSTVRLDDGSLMVIPVGLTGEETGFPDDELIAGIDRITFILRNFSNIDIDVLTQANAVSIPGQERMDDRRLIQLALSRIVASRLDTKTTQALEVDQVGSVEASSNLSAPLLQLKITPQ